MDMLLTGFDAPVEQVLYLDRPLREHGLVQVIARVNRRFPHRKDGAETEKTHGVVVDYCGISASWSLLQTPTRRATTKPTCSSGSTPTTASSPG